VDKDTLFEAASSVMLLLRGSSHDVEQTMTVKVRVRKFKK